jgi:hypothetical protein
MRNAKSTPTLSAFSLSLYLSIYPIYLFISLFLTVEEGAHTLLTDQRDKEKERGREIKRERERGREREGEREREKGRGNCPELLFLFLKGMTGGKPFSYKVL